MEIFPGLTQRECVIVYREKIAKQRRVINRELGMDRS